MAFIDLILSCFSRNASERYLARLHSTVEKINKLEKEYQKLSDSDLVVKTELFKRRIADGEKIDSLLCEAFAVVKNACRRLCGSKMLVCGIETEWNMIPYDEQIFAGIVLHRNGIAEMATGEGKTLAAAMPLYLNALSCHGAHLVTVNDYLARRDSEWIGAVLRYLGLTVGCIQTGQQLEQRRRAYQCDITYGANSEFGFDYLRDNGIARSREEMVQRPLFFAIIDEIDSVLIDEARTPLIIAGTREIPFNQYEKCKPKIRRLVELQRNLAGKILEQAAGILNRNQESPEAMRCLFQVRLGMPLHRQLQKILENPAVHHRLDDYDNRMRSSLAATTLSELKRELYFVVDEKHRQVELTEKGYSILADDSENIFLFPDQEKEIAEIKKNHAWSDREKEALIHAFHSRYAEQLDTVQNFMQLLQAYCLFEKDVHYIVQDGQILIVDEHTGRALPGRRFNDGLHQGLEAKEGVKVKPENITYASITQQNYFRLYKKLAGMTGTASTESTEFYNIYKLQVFKIPTHKPVCRTLGQDLIFRTKREKFNAIVEELRERYAKGQPVLLGTPSVEDSETLSRMLRMKKIPHQVLNAKQNQQEAEIIAKAGMKGSVTVATNMAGRGTDIKLGENVPELGGLCVIGSSRHDARRIDLQLQGRCSRQGDPGESRFYVSLEDHFMRVFGPENAVKVFAGYENVTMLHGHLLDNMIEKVQHKLEMRHYASRKHTLDYDDVMNLQRKVIYELRRNIIDGKQDDVLDEFLYRRIFLLCEKAAEPRNVDDYMDYSFDWKYFTSGLTDLSGISLSPQSLALDSDAAVDNKMLTERVMPKIIAAFSQSIEIFSENERALIIRWILLESIDREWIDHLNAMESLSASIYLVSFAQKDPLVAYKKEAYEQFEALMERISDTVLKNMFIKKTFATDVTGAIKGNQAPHNEHAIKKRKAAV